MTENQNEKIAPPIGSDAPDENEARTAARAAAKATPYADPTLPEGPYFLDDNLTELTDAGHALILKSVLAGNTQDLVGKQLGFDKPIAFTKKVNRVGSPLYNAFRLANAELDSEYMRRQTYRALVLRSPDAIAFGLRQRGYSEKTAPSSVVNVDVGNKVLFAPPGTNYEDFVEFQKAMAADGKIVHSASHSEDAYRATIGQTDDGDQRSDAAKKLHREMHLLPAPAAPASCDDLPPLVNPDE